MRRDLPTGTVTFVFADIAGSTKLLNNLGGDAYARELAKHRVTLRATFARYDGVEVDTQGDSFFIAFPTADRALEAMSDVTRSLERGPIRVRVGIHTGAPLLTSEGYVGTDVHRASRIASSGHGGQVLVSATTSVLVDADRFELVDLGYHRLKDLPRPERIFQLGSSRFPPLRSLSPSNLPVPATPFLGRREELDRLTTLLRDPDVRVVTLTGAGGTGKTRLAIAAAAGCSDSFPDGRWWVPLAPLSDPSLVLSAMATVMAVEERPDIALTSQLAARLSGGRSLVLLDNAEHLLPPLASELAPVIRDSDGATFLVTSRAPLRVGAEHEFPVPAMSPDDAQTFILSRAAAVGVELEPSPALITLCRRLDYLPLAMQLMAARLKLFSVERLIERLANVLDLAGQRDADPRQQTLRATIEWSHSLLSSEESVAFRRLAVFAGGATMEAIEDVTQADVQTISALLDQSIVLRRDDALGPRMWMLETIHEFARERLSEAGDMEAVRERHASYYRSVAERAGSGLDESRREWLDVLDAELDNVRMAMSWFLKRADHRSVQLIAGSLGVYWFDRGLLSEMGSWIEHSLEAGGDRGAEHTLALTRLSQVTYMQGDYERARTAAEEALAQARMLRDPVAVVLAMDGLAAARVAQGYPDQAWDLEQEALEIARGLSRARRLLVVALSNLGYTCLTRTLHKAAARYFEEALALALDLGEATNAGAARCNLAISLVQLGRINEAGRIGAEAMISAIESSDQTLGTACLEVLAAVEIQRGNHRFGARLLGASEVTRGKLGYELEPAERALHERTLAIMRNALTGAELDAAWREGAALNLEDAFALIGREFIE
jgi:predicted ATPase/class 3 adenylate cyclase